MLDEEIEELGNDIRWSLNEEFDRQVGVDVEGEAILIQPDYIFTEEMHVLRADIREEFGWQFDFRAEDDQLRVRPLSDEEYEEKMDSMADEVAEEIAEEWGDEEVIERAREVLRIVRQSRVGFAYVRRWDIRDRCIRLGQYRGRGEAEIVRDSVLDFDEEDVIREASIERLYDARKSINKHWFAVDLMVAEGSVLDTLG